MCTDEEFEQIKNTGSDFSIEMEYKVVASKKKAEKIVKDTEKLLRSLLL